MGAFREFQAGMDDVGRRLDRVARNLLAGTPLSAIHRAIRKGKVRVNGERASPERRISPGDSLQVWSGLENEVAERIPASDPSPSTLPLPKILLETPDILFVDKPAGLLVHDGRNSLDARVRAYLAPTLAPSLSFTPGPLHRLDRNTSGVLAFSKTLRGAHLFGEELKGGRVVKIYLAILSGNVQSEQAWSDSLVRDEATKTTFVTAKTPNEAENAAHPAREALTRVFPLSFAAGQSLVALRLETGRTHQIRAQAASRGHPLVGDRKYGAPAADFPYCLHAWILEITADLMPELPSRIVSPLPAQFSRILGESFSLDEKEVYSLLRQALP
jgi:23S rRNA pseudouridine955/2504/2580 synthase